MPRVFEQGLDRVVGYVLPLRRHWTSNPGWHWESGRWFLRPEHLFLIPGDSPIGYRLPLDSLPWVTKTDYPYIYEQDLHVERPPLPPTADARRARLFGVSQIVGIRASARSQVPCRHNAACPIPA